MDTLETLTLADQVEMEPDSIATSTRDEWSGLSGILDPDLLAGVYGAGPADLAVESNRMTPAALAYTIGPSAGPSTTLQLIHAADAILGQRVDFVG